MLRIVKFFGCGQLATKRDLMESENRIKELILKAASELDKAKIKVMLDELAQHRASLAEAIEKNK